MPNQGAEPSKRWPPGSRVGESYTVLTCLGEGGSGVVYKVRNDETGAIEALKVPPPHLLGTRNAREAFLHEARIAEKLRHPHLVSIHKVGILPEVEQVFLTMALMSGGDLGQVLERAVLENRPLEVAQVMTWMGQVAEALAYLHGQGLVHQDLKPANILLDDQGGAHLGDFGLAFMPVNETVTEHIRNSTVVGGTTYFMSPEQHQAIFYRKNVPITPASDVCAFGLTLYNLISGEIIAGSREPAGEFVADPDLASELDKFLGHCLARKPEKRFPSGQELLLDFRQLAALVPTPCEPSQRKKTSIFERLKAGAFRDPLKPGTTRRIYLAPGCELTLAWIPPGRFWMGSPEDEPERSHDERLHEVILTRGFWMMTTPVTQKQWRLVMGDQPWFHKGKNLPVEMVSWKDVQAFLQRCNRLQPSIQLQLPTEAQWEYACRAGTDTPFAGKVNAMAWHAGNAKGSIRRVAGKKANAWGLSDMHGNVWEWCADHYDAYQSGTVSDPKGPAIGEHRVIRGGSFDYAPKYARSASRYRYSPENKNINIGFRLIAAGGLDGT